VLVARPGAVALLHASQLPGAKRDLGRPERLALAGAPRVELEHVLHVHPVLLRFVVSQRATDVPPAISNEEIAAGLGKTAGKSTPLSDSAISGPENDEGDPSGRLAWSCMTLDR
jgi:hypothetical protein